MTVPNLSVPNALPAIVLFILGLVDLMRGILHTFCSSWAVKTFAKLDLSAARQDQLMLLGAFGISNFLTGVIFIMISLEAPALSRYVLLIVPCAYITGAIGMRIAGVRRQSAFLGRYFMLAYLAVCLATFVLSQFVR